MEHSTADLTDEQNLRFGDGKAAAAKKPSGYGITLLILTVVAMGGLIAYGAMPRILQKQALEKHTSEQKSLARPVSVVEAKPGSAIEEFTLPGSTEAIQDAAIYARVNGYVHQRYVNIGDLVHAGQLLADIETPELDQQVQAAESSFEQAGASLDNARQTLTRVKADAKSAAANVQKARTDLQYYTEELKRYRELVAQGAVSVEDKDTRLQAYNSGVATLDSMIATERAAQASISSAQAAVHVAQAAVNAAKFQRDQYEATRSFRKVVAPFDGVITRRNVDAGALITAGSNSSNSLLFEVAETDILEIFVYVPEQYVSFIRPGEHAKLRFQEFEGREFDGVVTNVSGGIDPASKTLQVELHAKNGNHKLLPGMYAKVTFQAPAQVRLAIVPATTLQVRPDGGFIYTVDKENHAHMHKVTIGRDLGGHFEIASGIKTGDLCIVNPSDELRDDMLVSPVRSQEPKPEKKN